jgi:acyl-CoA synthetase (AMP-forming)/AMP-acid ligase II
VSGSIGELLRARAEAAPGAALLRFAGETTSRADLDTAVSRTARALHDLGVRRGDRVAVLMRNRPEYLHAWLGIVGLGAIFVPVIADNRPAEVDHVLLHSGSVALIVADDLLGPLGDVRARCPELRHLLVVGAAPAGTVDFAAARDAASVSLPGAGPASADIAQIAYTSGTTARPKGVLLTHYAYVRTGQEFARFYGLTEADRLMVVLPLFHGAAQIAAVMPSLACGAELALFPRFSVSRFWDDVAAVDPTQVGLMHGMASMLLSSPEGPVPSHRIRFSWGTTTPPIEAAMRERFGVKMTTTYGLSECSFVTSAPLDRPYRPGWAGVRAMADMEVRVVDPESAAPLPSGEVGVIAVRSPCATPGYYRDPVETAKALRDGWLLSGDLGRLDADGELYFEGKRKHVIRRSGENISGEEVEAAVLEHPAVELCSASAVKDDVREEEVKVEVVLERGAVLTEPELVDWCEERLAPFKVPRYVAIAAAGSAPPEGGAEADPWDRLRAGHGVEWRPGWRIGEVPR